MTTSYSLYLPRNSGLHRLHPLTVLAIVVFCLVAGLALPGPWGPYVVFAFVVVPLAAWGKVLPDLISAAFKIVIPFAISVFLIQGFFWQDGTPIFTIGPLSLKREGVLFAVQSAGRILSIVGAFLLLTLTVRPDRLMIALDQRGAPKALTYIVLATIQIVPRFRAKASTILDAQRARGLETEGGIGRRVRAMLPLVVPLVLSSIIDIEERAMSLEARAFARSGVKTSLLTLTDTPGQRAGRILLILAMFAAVGVGIWLRRVL